MQQDIHLFIKDLITIPSESNNQQAQDAILELALSKLTRYTVELFTHKGVRSALVYNRSTRPEKFRVILNAHLDVIPAQPEQYLPRTEGNKLYGAGAMDMKGGAACLISVFNEIAETVPYPLALQLTTDEEVGGFNGTKHQINQGVKADFVLAGEPTNLEVVHKAKGVLQVKVHAKGSSAHGAYPWKGDNALEKLLVFLTRLQTKFPNPSDDTWKTTVNISKIATPNHAFNKIPDRAEAWLDIRFTPEDESTIKADVSACLLPECALEEIFFESSMHTAATHPLVAKLAEHTQYATQKPIKIRGANGSSDARHFVVAGSAGVEFGPIGGGIGSDTEWVNVASLETYCKILKNFLQDIT